jgi:large subunit ribosomal protein L23
MKAPYQIVLGPVITEKGTDMTQKDNKILFKVDARCNKIEIRKAIEELYSVKVIEINTVNVKGKPKRLRMQLGRTSNWKKAIVTLKEGDKIEFT